MMIMSFVLVTLSVLGIVGFILYTQHHQKLRIDRARRLMATMEKAKRSMYALETLPEHYLKPNLRRYLVSSWYNAQKAYIEACPEPSNRELKQFEQAQQAQESLNEVVAGANMGEIGRSSETGNSPDLSSSEQAKDIRSLLKNLHMQIKEDYTEKRLNKNQALALMDEIKTILNQLGVDLHLSLARVAEKKGDLSKALAGYRRALAACKKNAHHEQQNQHLEERISNLMLQVQQQQQARQQATSDRLEQGISALDNEFTPKKNIYD